MKVPRVLAADWPKLYGELQSLVNAEKQWREATEKFLTAAPNADNDTCKDVAIAEHAFTDIAKELVSYLRSIGFRTERSS